MNSDQMNSCSIILLCGLYGSGKTEFSARNFRNRSRYRISRSELRKLMFEMTNFGEPWTSDKFNEEDDVLVKHVERKILEHFIHNKRNVVIINTFMTAQSRARFVKIAKEMKKTIGAIFLDPPVEKCIERNSRASSNIPVSVIRSLSLKKELPVKKEGFDEVLVVTDFNS
jgi:predicted kinase